ncbi:MAG: methylenetetrahydrofolate--tRNA-(uracil(54)-C(5))-methyltransferase (FADH(2)-oxidizing) TrmFO [Syntrophomonadaceae bacterium]|nr:methylenetetrahydrofolate--tRNA-(uracil(54)-C(5))-methyltransferase (FADH(2)-oxidizing) TrmFO [Syntrophomonadaceae bacterium]
MKEDRVMVIGGGLAGCEAAFALANCGIPVDLYEMRPHRQTPAHKTGLLGELVCSNSLKSEDIGTAQGVLKQEMRRIGSIILEIADRCRVPAGSALAVDRHLLGSYLTETISNHPLIQVINEEVRDLPDSRLTVVASGPLTSDALSESLIELTGQEHLFFFDAVAPILDAGSIDMAKVYWGSRYGKGESDYLNCPLSEEEYDRFYQELINADSLPVTEVDQGLYFSACTPIEVMARKGRDTLRFGPMRPVGLPDPRNDKVPYAVVQLRNENREGTMVSPVGFQTRMKWGEQERVLRLIPGLENAKFLRLGVMHRNTYINSPQLLNTALQFKDRPNLFFAGQIIGVEGYMESAATGIIAGINAGRRCLGSELATVPEDTMLGSLINYVCDPQQERFQPMNANFGLLPPLGIKVRKRADRKLQLAKRSELKIREFSEIFVN